MTISFRPILVRPRAGGIHPRVFQRYGAAKVHWCVGCTMLEHCIIVLQLGLSAERTPPGPPGAFRVNILSRLKA